MKTRNRAYRVALKGNWRRTAVGVLRRALEHNGRQMLIVHTEHPNAARIEKTGIRVEETRDGMRRHGSEPGEDGLLVDSLHVRIEAGRGDRSLEKEILDLETDVAFHPVDVDRESLESRPIVTRAACAKLTAGELAERIYRCLFAAGEGSAIDGEGLLMAQLIGKAQRLRWASRPLGHQAPEASSTGRYACRQNGDRLESMRLPPRRDRAAVIAGRMRRPEAWTSNATDWHDDTGADTDRLDAVATRAEMKHAGYEINADLPKIDDSGPVIEIWSQKNIEEMDTETSVKVIRDDGDTTRVTSKSGATTLAEVRPTEPPAETWTVIKVYPTGMRKPGECGSYHEAVGRAVDHAMSRQRNG